MKKIAIILIILFCLSGCSVSSTSDINLTTIYGINSILSGILLVGCYFTAKTNRVWLLSLFISVLTVNFGYTLLSASSTIEIALHANRLSYLGSVFLPFNMLMIILEVTNTKYSKYLPKILFSLAIVVFLIAGSPGILDIYYKEVSLVITNSGSTLNKVYGPLHPIYLVYLLGYFGSMVTIVIRSITRKTVETTYHGIFLAIAVFVNIGVWLIEQFISINFEMLSISYIISEFFLLSMHLIANENQRLRNIIKQAQTHEFTQSNDFSSAILTNDTFDENRIETFIAGLDTLTPTEKTIYQAYISRITTVEILNSLNIKENTLKYHNRNLYGKLGVKSRKELLEIYKHVQLLKNTIDK